MALVDVAMNPTEKRMFELLCAGVSQEDTATASGVSPSVVSTFIAREEIAKLVQSKRSAQLLKASQHDVNLAELEASVLKKLKDSLSAEYDQRKLLAAFRVLNGANRRYQSGGSGQSVTVTQTVTLVMPTAVMKNYVVNSQGAVVSAGEQSLTTISASSLREKAASQGSTP